MNTKEYVSILIEKLKSYKIPHCKKIDGDYYIWFYSSKHLNHVDTNDIVNILGGHWKLDTYAILNDKNIRYRFINRHIETDMRNYYLNELI